MIKSYTSTVICFIQAILVSFLVSVILKTFLATMEKLCRPVAGNEEPHVAAIW